jgi:hypothetical protein
MFWVLLVRVSILLESISTFEDMGLAMSYNAIVRRELMLLVKYDILVPEKHHAPLLLLATQRNIHFSSAPTSATSNANSSFAHQSIYSTEFP